MTMICTICARGGSTGVKNKNIKLLCGKPLIAHSIIQAKQSCLFDYIVVSSDSQKILSIAKQWGADYLVNRPILLATATAAKLPVIQHAVLSTETQFNKAFDVMVDLDVTAPLRTVADITEAVSQLTHHPTADNLVTACLSRKSPYFNMLEKTDDGFVTLSKKSAQPVARRQDVPLCYEMNASIYVWKRTSFFDVKTVITEKTLLYVMPPERSLDIDSQLDWKMVSLLAKKRTDLFRSSR